MSQVWREALAEKQQAPYMRQTLASAGLRGLRFCPYEVGHPVKQGDRLSIPLHMQCQHWNSCRAFQALYPAALLSK